MKSSEIRKKYIEFFVSRGHIEIPSASLVPENDPTTLFNSSGMQPLVPYLLGQPHPSGKRLVNSQKAVRLQDIEEVGDNRHTTFFEMLGNWSLGDYFKKEQLPWIFEFLTTSLGLSPKRLYVTVFEGNTAVPKDTDSITTWKEIFAQAGVNAREGERIFAYPAKKNWWSRSGEPEKMPPGEPGGPDSEVFFDFGEELGLHARSEWKSEMCHPNCDCGRFMEIANSVFMQYIKQSDGSLIELPQKNVDFGGGLERMVAAVQNNSDVFVSDFFSPTIQILSTLTHKTYGSEEESTKAMRIIVDHARAAVMLIGDGVLPSNKAQGYILRRLIRRSLLYGKKLGLSDFHFLTQLVEPIVSVYKDAYPTIPSRREEIEHTIDEEAMRFGKSIDRGLKEIEAIATLDGKIAFTLYERYGFPWEMTVEIAREKGQVVSQEEFEAEFQKHQNLSRTAAAGMFKGGLADHSEDTTKLHTATHLLHEALHRVLGEHIQQKGSNITAERLRFDFSHQTKLTDEQIRAVEQIVNQQIQENLPVSYETVAKDIALNSGARAFFGERYADKVKVYKIGNFSQEICGGPHVDFTGTLGHFTIKKEESAGAGIRRIYATLTSYEAARVNTTLTKKTGSRA